MSATTYFDVLESFESSFVDRYEIPDELSLRWFKKAIGEYSLELSDLYYDYTNDKFINEDGEDLTLSESIITTLATLMKKYYQEREYDRVNKINNIIGKDVSLNNTDSTKKHTKEELDYVKNTGDSYLFKQKSTAYN